MHLCSAFYYSYSQKSCFDFTNFVFFSSFEFLKVWFQNRRMKDKRQRIAVTWPYAAVYSDPSFAASILQAAAQSIGMPYCAPNVMHPQLPMIPTESSHQYAYGYHRYMPYQMHHRNAAGLPSLAHPHILPLSSSPNEAVFTRLDSCLENDYFENSSSTSPSNSLSSISDVEKVNFHCSKSIRRHHRINANINSFFCSYFLDVIPARTTSNTTKPDQKYEWKKYHNKNDQIGQTEIISAI